MCPACLASAGLIVGSVISTGGLAALIAKVRTKNMYRKSASQNSNPKEESWEK